ncbi:MAG: tripartite tricarboxylate transporter permease, partial [Candidatus Binatia bacterium]
WLAYAHSVQSSPDKQRFGKGAVEGVLGPGAANNSTLGGSMITTVAFGVPASVTMAILLGAFIIQGIVPGPDMLIPAPKGKLDLTFSFVWVIIISNVITVAACFLFLNPLAKITQVRGSLLIPFILLLIYLGAFAEKNAFQDMIVVLFFGALGWVLEKLQWPRPPLLLGLVLGPLAENRLFLSTDNYGIAWLWRPGVLIILAITLVGIFYPVIKERRSQKKSSNETPDAPIAADKVAVDRSRLRLSALFAFLILALLALALWQSRNFGFRAGLFPWAIGFPLLALAAVQLFFDLTGKTKLKDDGFVPGPDLPKQVVTRRTMSICAWTLGFFLGIWLLGFFWAVPLMILLYVKFAGNEKWPIAIVLSAIGWLFFYLLFMRLLHVPFTDPVIPIPIPSFLIF